MTNPMNFKNFYSICFSPLIFMYNCLQLVSMNCNKLPRKFGGIGIIKDTYCHIIFEQTGIVQVFVTKNWVMKSFLLNNLIEYSSPPLICSGYVPRPQGMPKTADSRELYIYYVFSYTNGWVAYTAWICLRFTKESKSI